MDLRKFLPGTNNEDKTQENYWSLVIEPGWVTSGMWTVEEKTARVLTSSLPVVWEEKEELVNATDSVLSVATQGTPEEVDEPSKTVFGVSAAWVTSGEIRPEYLLEIKELCTKLSLTPIGFVVIPEAISHYIKNDEGSAPSIVTIGVYKEVVEVSVFRTGKLVGSTQVSRSVNLDDDVVEGISRFIDNEPIPTRFILYNSKEGELEDARQSLIKVNWEDYTDLKLLHTPKIEILNSDQKVSAVCLAGASEIADVTSLKEVGDKHLSPPFVIDSMTEPKKTPSMGSQDELVSVKENIETPKAEDLGFVTEKDNDVKEPKVKTEVFSELNDEVNVKFSNVVPARVKTVTVENYVPQRPHEEGGEKKSFFPQLEKKPIYTGLISLFAIILLGALYWWFIPKAFVTVYVSPQKLEQKIDLKVSLNEGSTDFSSKIVQAKSREVEVSGEKTKETTGSKTVGDKAKGEVTLYRVGPGLSVKAGTILYGPESLKFILDEAVDIAAGSASTPGTTKVKVTSEGIGSEYNLASGANFSVGNFSTTDIEARNESAFSGGSSRQISAVSDADKKTLSSELTEELIEKAANKASEDILPDDLVVNESNAFTVVSETFSDKVGDESSVLKLGLDLKVKTLIISKKSLTDLIKNELNAKIPEGYTMPENQIDFSFNSQIVPDDNLEFTVDITANLVPSIDIDSLKKKVKGKYVTKVGEIFENEVPGYSGVEVRLKPFLPGRLKTMPHVLSNIEIDLSSEK